MGRRGHPSEFRRGALYLVESSRPSAEVAKDLVTSDLIDLCLAALRPHPPLRRAGVVESAEAPVRRRPPTDHSAGTNILEHMSKPIMYRSEADFQLWGGQGYVVF